MNKNRSVAGVRKDSEVLQQHRAKGIVHRTQSQTDFFPGTMTQLRIKRMNPDTADQDRILDLIRAYDEDEAERTKGAALKQ